MDTDRTATGSDPVDRLAEEYLARRRRGERPTPSEYAARHPEHAARILELFPALELIERLKPAPGDGAGRSGDTGPAPEPAVAAGDRLRRLGDYAIVRELGRGGMGVVYEAEHESLRNRVALKVMHVRFRADPMSLRRFEREARSAARLHHTNIVPVFDYGEQDGVCYYAMPYIAGVGLERVLEDVRRLRSAAGGDGAGGAETAGASAATEGAVDPLPVVSRGLLTGRFAAGPAPSSGSDPSATASFDPQATGAGAGVAPASPDRPAPVPPATDATSGGSTFASQSEAVYFREVTRIAAQVADALDYAHRQGVIHRDIKPSNLLLDARGNVWVTDFGLAKLVEGEDLSRSHDVVGTLRYMAPERFRGVTDPRGDIYALGATLYELLTLEPAFGERDQARLIERIAHEPPEPPRRYDRRIPRDLETLVLKALAKEPAERFATAGELRDELGRYLESRPIRSRPIGAAERVWRWCRRNPIVAGLLGAVAGLTLALAIGSTAALVRLQAAATELRAANASEVQANAALRDSVERERERFELAMVAIKTFHTGVSGEVLLKEARLQELRTRLLRGAADFYGRLEALLKDQTDRRSRQALAQAYFELGDLIDTIGSRVEALEAHRKALAIRRELAAGPGAEPAAKLDLARSLVFTGLMRESGNDHHGVRAMYEEARALGEEVVRSDGGSEPARAFLARCHARIGWFLSVYNDPDGSMDAFEHAIPLYQALADERPDEDEYRQGLGASLGGLGVQLQLRGRLEEALAACRRGLALYRALAAARPEILRNQQNLGNAHGYVADILVDMDRPDEALAEDRVARDVFENLARSHPNATHPRVLLADTYIQLASKLELMGRVAEAKEAFQKASELSRDLFDNDTIPGIYLEQWAFAIYGLGAIEESLGHLNDARAQYEKTLAVLKQLSDAAPGHLRLLDALARNHRAVGRVHGWLNRPAEAMAAYERALALDRRMVREHPDLGGPRLELAAALGEIAWLRRRSDRPAGVAALLREAVGLRERTAVVGARSRFEQARDLARLGSLAAVPGSGVSDAEGRAALERAVPWLRKAVAGGLRITEPRRAEADLAPLSTRPDFRALLMDLAMPAEPFAPGP